MTYAVVMSYADRSGIIAVFGPYKDESTAVAVAQSLNHSIWIAPGVFDVIPMVTHFGDN